MNFQYLGSFEKILNKKRLERLLYQDQDRVYFFYGDGSNKIAVYHFKISKYAGLYVFKTSVLESYGKVFGFINANDEESICIFIPDYDFLVSCIVLRDLEALRASKKWLTTLTRVFKNLDTCYKNSSIRLTFIEVGENDKELMECIPSQFPINEEDIYDQEVTRNGYPIPIPLKSRRVEQTTPFNSKILNSIKNYNPSVISSFIARRSENLRFKCSNMIEYHALLDSGIDKSRIRLILTSLSLSEFIMTAAHNIDYVNAIRTEEIVDYLITVNEDNISKLIIISMVDETAQKDETIDSTPVKRIIEACIKKYGSIEDAPDNIREDITNLFHWTNPIYEHLRPLIEYIASYGEPIMSESRTFELVFPGIPTLITDPENDKEHISVYSRWTTDYTKEQFFSRLAHKYNYTAMMKLYDLFLQGFITKEEIIETGLQNVYASVDWMINRIVRMKAAK